VGRPLAVYLYMHPVCHARMLWDALPMLSI
jgi:hypothetical protein